jgi:TPR repeat protein
MYRDGIGASRNPERAKHYFKRASVLGDPDGLTELGCIEWNAEKAKSNRTLAVAMWKRALKRGSLTAAWHLGEIYLDEFKMTSRLEDLMRSIRFLELADRNNKVARRSLIFALNQRNGFSSPDESNGRGSKARKR